MMMCRRFMIGRRITLNRFVVVGLRSRIDVLRVLGEGQEPGCDRSGMIMVMSMHMASTLKPGCSLSRQDRATCGKRDEHKDGKKATHAQP